MHYNCNALHCTIKGETKHTFEGPRCDKLIEGTLSNRTAGLYPSRGVL